MSNKKTATNCGGFVVAKCERDDCSLPRTQHHGSSRFEFVWYCTACDKACAVPVRAWREAPSSVCSDCDHNHSDHRGRTGVNTSWLRPDAAGYLCVCHTQWQDLDFDSCEVEGDAQDEPDDAEEAS